jgi:hypothetical protein
MGKKLIILTFILFLVCHLVSAFDLTVGIKGGCNISGMYGHEYWEILNDLMILVFGEEKAMDYVYPFNIQVGGYVCMGILDFLAIETEVYYTRLGDLVKGDAGSIENMTNFLEISVLLNIRIGQKGATFNLFAGPDFLWNMANEGAINVYDKDNNKIAELSFDEAEINSWLLGMAAGFGFDFDISNFVISFDIKYVAPLQEFYTDKVLYHDFALVNFQFLVGIGYKIF